MMRVIRVYDGVVSSLVPLIYTYYINFRLRLPIND